MKELRHAIQLTSTPVLLKDVVPHTTCVDTQRMIEQTISSRRRKFAQDVWKKYHKLTKQLMPDEKYASVLKKYDDMWDQYCHCLEKNEIRTISFDPFSKQTYDHREFIEHFEYVASLHYANSYLLGELKGSDLYKKLLQRYTPEIIENHWMSNREMTCIYCRQAFTIGTVFEVKKVAEDVLQSICHQDGDFNIHILRGYMHRAMKKIDEPKCKDLCLSILEDWVIEKPFELSCDVLAKLLLFCSPLNNIKLLRQLLCKPVLVCTSKENPNSEEGTVFLSLIHFLYNL